MNLPQVSRCPLPLTRLPVNLGDGQIYQLPNRHTYRIIPYELWDINPFGSAVQEGQLTYLETELTDYYQTSAQY